MTDPFERPLFRSWPATIPSDDRGFLLGDALFETVPVYGGRPFRLDRHLGRLRSAADAVGIGVPSDLDARVAQVLASLGDGTAALRVTLSRGSGSGLLPPGPQTPRLVVSLREMPSHTPTSGLSAALYGRVDERALTAGLKSTTYLERVQALRMARAEGRDEALLRNVRDLVVEGSASNVLAVVDTRIVAPGPADGALPGVTREAVLEVADGDAMEIDERGIAPSELRDASEVLLSSALRGLVPVVEVDGVAVGTGRPGPVFERLSRGLASLVRAETGRSGPGRKEPAQPSP